MDEKGTFEEDQTDYIGSDVALPTGCATSCKQANSKQIEEVVENRQEVLTLIISSEGR